jgi:hypothetical protein
MYYGRSGPGGGSLPEWVLKTGAISPFDPRDVRHDIESVNVERETHIPVGTEPGAAQYSPPCGMGALLGAEPTGRPVREFKIVGAPSAADAAGLAAVLRNTAKFLKRQGLESAAPAIVGGPISALARGEAIVLRWPNGIAIKAVL